MTSVRGTCAPRFGDVRREFEQAFHAEGLDAEHGAAFCVFHDGVSAIDLWGGWADAGRTRAWQGETRAPIFSATKALAAMVIHRLISEDAFTLDTPIAELWPAFADHGKGGITIGHVLDHSSGVPWVAPGTRGLGFEQARWEAAIVGTPPSHAPGTRHIYHAVTQGFILDAIAIRVAGQPVAALFDRWFAGAADGEVRIGASPRPEETVEIVPCPPPPGSPAPRPEAVEQLLQLLDPTHFNDAAFRNARLPAATGQATARGLARLFHALAVERTLIDTEALTTATALRWDATEAISGLRWRMAAGFMLSGGFAPMGPNADAFGHPGRGGATVFADPVRRLTVAYIPNRPDPRPDAPRLRKILRPLYESL